MIRALLGKLVEGESLSAEDTASAVEQMMTGDCDPVVIAAFLTAWRIKGESIDEVAGAAAALRRNMTPIRSAHRDFVDTCGTGGDGSGTFNISTASALVIAAAGLPVAKHGNRAASSRTGSADVLAALGVNVEASAEVVERCLADLGVAFCFAPLWHQAMKHVGPVRRQLPFRTLFNVLGPLANPAGAPYQIIGVGRPELRRKMAEALAQLGCRRAAVVWGEDGLDEVTVSGPTQVSLVDGKQVVDQVWTPADFGLETSSLEALAADGPEQSAAVIRRVLSGHRDAARDIVAANAGAALFIAGRVEDLASGARRAEQAIDDGSASALLARLVEASHGRS